MSALGGKQSFTAGDYMRSSLRRNRPQVAAGCVPIMKIRDYWWTAIGSNGQAVPVPFDLRIGAFPGEALRHGLIVGCAAASLLTLGSVISPHWIQGDLVRRAAIILLSAVVLGLCTCAFNLVVDLAVWATQRRRLGESLEATAGAWSLSELDGHIRDIRLKHANAEGYTKLLHARHLAWLQARRDGTPEG